MKKYRDIPKDKILKFKATPGFKGYEHFFTENAVTHPAKMNLNLLRWILSNYTEPNNVVLDPMAGTGSTTILASAMGRNSIAVEYEPKFCKMIEENIGRTQIQGGLAPRGKMAVIKGDARELSKHLIESDVIISSPPYGNRLADVANQDGDPARMSYRQTVDIVLTSPPYENTTLHGKNEEARKQRLTDAGYNAEKYLGGRARNTVLKKYVDVDTIITSPPYGEAQSGGGIATKGYQGPKHTPTDLIGNRSYTPSKFEHNDNISLLSYGDNKSTENIGNLKGETYLGAMTRVYQECYNVLTPQGKMVLVIKNFIRDKTVVRLDLDTIKLCESVGFNLIDRWYFDLPNKSFWKILYHKKYPNVPEIKYEDVLVFEKKV